MTKSFSEYLNFVGQKPHGQEKPGKLRAIAQEMIQFARQHPYDGKNLAPYTQTLPRGLVLSCITGSGESLMAISREGIYPSAKEEEICRAAFNVPDTARREIKQKGRWCHITYTWPDGPAPLVTLRFDASSAPAALPAGAWRKIDGFLYVDIWDRDMLYWFVVANLAAKEAALNPGQISMFELPDQDRSYMEVS